MESYEERLGMIDDAILNNSGKWVSPFNHLLVSTKHHPLVGEGYYNQVDIVRPKMCAKPYWEYVCSKEEFMQRKQELQSKPDWKDAPEWANWLAQDESGEWYWHQGKPTADSYYYMWDSKQKVMYTKHMGDVLIDWRDTLEERPIPAPDIIYTCGLQDTNRTYINAEHVDIVMPDGTKFRLLDLLLEHKAIKRHTLEQEVAGILQENGHVDAVSVAKMVLAKLEEKNDE